MYAVQVSFASVGSIARSNGTREVPQLVDFKDWFWLIFHTKEQDVFEFLKYFCAFAIVNVKFQL